MADNAPFDLPLAAEFPPATAEAWQKLVAGVLKGASADKLVHRTYDELRIEPLYARATEARPVPARPAGVPWRVMQRVDHPDPAAANAEALHDLENGATALLVVCAGSSATGYGIDGSAAALERVLRDVDLEAGVVFDFSISAQTRDVVRHFAALVKSRKASPANVELRAGLNPLGGLAATGGGDKGWSELTPVFTGLLGELVGQGFRGPLALADGRIIHNAGGSEAQELAFTLACAVAYLRALEASGIAVETARDLIYFRLAADADQFLTIAKFRALRKLWAHVEQACGLEPKPAEVTAETAWRSMTRRDPWVNILRTTLAVFSAAIGGADAIIALPHTTALGLPDRFARRIARNTQLILLEESNLAKIADPAAGSGALEAITDALCQSAWSLLQEIEASGGVAAAFETGLIQRKVAEVRSKREAAVAQRTEAITGTSEYPHLAEMPVSVLDVPSPARPPSSNKPRFEPLPRIRLAEPYERLRDTSDRKLADTGARPKVFLANLGHPSDFTARMVFAKNFFEAGGIEAIPFHPAAPPGAANESAHGTDFAALVKAFSSSGAKLACVCSSDDVYARDAVAAAKALAAARHIYLAGRPRDEAPLRDAGIGTFIVARSDAITVLTKAHEFA
jgi:methylmalonyl-CoA mutase